MSKYTFSGEELHLILNSEANLVSAALDHLKGKCKAVYPEHVVRLYQEASLPRNKDRAFKVLTHVKQEAVIMIEDIMWPHLYGRRYPFINYSTHLFTFLWGGDTDEGWKPDDVPDSWYYHRPPCEELASAFELTKKYNVNMRSVFVNSNAVDFFVTHPEFVKKEWKSSEKLILALDTVYEDENGLKHWKGMRWNGSVMREVLHPFNRPLQYEEKQYEYVTCEILTLNKDEDGATTTKLHAR